MRGRQVKKHLRLDKLRVAFAEGLLPPGPANEVVLQKSIPAQIRLVILYISNDEGYVDEFVRELTFAKNDVINTLCEIRAVLLHLPRWAIARTPQKLISHTV